jgi:uncharacterized protein YbjT (DUF2867 family)
MVVITGATGALNGATVEHLLKRIPAGQIGVSVRDTAKAQHFADRGVRVRRGSYEDPAALLDSLEGEGTPGLMARFQLGFFQAAREGHFAGTGPLLGDLLGHQPRTVRDLLAGRTTA